MGTMSRFSLSWSKRIKLDQILKLLPFLILLVYLLLSALSFLTAEKRELINAFDDDAYLYFKIARNFSETGHMTFDGKSITNGFHPLWMMVLIPFYLALHDPIAVLRAIGIFSIILIAIMGFLSLRYLFRYSILTYFLASALLITSIISFGVTGMEVTLLLPLIIIVLVWVMHAKPWDASTISQIMLIAIGLNLSLVQLARLDAVFLTITILLFVAIMSAPRDRLKRVFMLGLFPFITGSIYLLVNYAVFQHFLPTSGAVKSLASNTLWFNHKFLSQLTTPNNAVDGNFWIFYLCLLFLSFGYLSLTTYKKFKHWKTPLSAEDYLPVIVSVFFIVYSAYQVFRTSWVLWRWYAYPIIPLSVFLVPEILSRIERHLQRYKNTRASIQVLSALILPLLTIQLFVLGIRFGYWIKPHGTSFQYENYLIAETLNHEPIDTSVFAVGDRAGSFAYFYHGNVLQLEGLVGDYKFLQALKSNTVMDYMTKFGVEYVMSYVAPSDGYSQWTLSTPLPWLSSGPYADIILCRQTEFKRIETQYSIYTIWKWPSCEIDTAITPVGSN